MRGKKRLSWKRGMELHPPLHPDFFPQSPGASFSAVPRSRPAFTLIEILAVLFIIGIVGAIVIPRFTNLRGIQLRSSARDLAGTLHLVYNTAVVKHTPYRMVFDLDKHEYLVEEKAGEEYVAAAEPLLAARLLPETVIIKAVHVLDRHCSGPGKEYLYFSPGGYVEEAAIYLATADGGQVYSIFTQPMTGRAVIVPEEVTREEWEKSEEGK